MSKLTREAERLEETRKGTAWKKWGPYLSERQWGSVRENTDRAIEAWNDVTHDQSRSRAYHSGEDGIAGFCDENMLLCFSLGLWNAKDPMLKERMFGLTNGEGNHGEDVKEYYFYLDSTPTHAYAKMLYKYPQAAFPYAQLVAENGRRSRTDMEYELLDTGIFDQDRYFDVYVEYAKTDPEDILIRISAVNRGPEAAPLHLVPYLWFRNTWWLDEHAPRPGLEALSDHGASVMVARHPQLGQRFLYCDGAPELLFADNETNNYRLWGQHNPSTYQKDGINDYIVTGRQNAVNPARKGTRAAAHATFNVEPGQTVQMKLRLTPRAPSELGQPFNGFEHTFGERIHEADEFYASLAPRSLSADAANVIRQSAAGLLWSKQAYVYDVREWLDERGVRRDPENQTRNHNWVHMYSADVISMPDKWEYPWFATWDLAFHSAALSAIDPDLAEQQLSLMLLDRYQHPNGQLPAYEWNFDDVNPPVHAWAAIFNYRMNRDTMGDQAIPFLKRTFNMLVSNFTWWLNRKDRDGHNLFEGGFLGLDNIGVFDRSAPLPTGGYLEQADGTAWMAFYAQNMLDMALELAMVDSTYEELAIKFFQHVVAITSATNRHGAADSMWDEQDGFYYDVLRVPGQYTTRLKIRSVVGLLPLCATSVFRPEVATRLPHFMERVQWYLERRPDLVANLNPPRTGVNGRYMLSVLSDAKLRRVLARMLDPNEFLGDYGIRSLSRYHLDHPYVFEAGGREYRVGYLPAESDTGMFGGNSNWRGPIWAPINALIVRALVAMYAFYGNEFRVECPTGSGQYMNLYEVANELSNRLNGVFLLNHEGRRPVFGGARKFQEDPHWKNNLLFYEYFHGDNGAGLGASHQTGWTAVIPALMRFFARVRPEAILAPGATVEDLRREHIHVTEGPGARP